MKPLRPWQLRSPWFSLLLFVPPFLLGWLVRDVITDGWLPVIVTAGAICINASIMINKWHEHCARHGHREDL